MLKKSVILQLILLACTMLLGTVLVSNTSAEVRMFHSGIGLLSGLNAIAVTYLTFKESSPSAVRYLAIATVGLTFLAGVGGKLAETDYATGLLLMRASALSAFITAAACLLNIKRKKGSSR